MTVPTALALPALRWLPEYRAEWLRPDLIAGLTLAAYLLPAGIGDASLAGLPPEAGLYACLFSGLIFWLFCSSKHTVVTVTSALSLLVGASVGELSAGDPARHAALAACVALIVSRHCVRGVARPRRHCRRLFFRNRARRLQGGTGAVPGEHAASQAVWLQGHARRFLGALGLLPRASGRHARGVLARGSGCVDRSHCRQALAQEPAGGVPCRRRRHAGGAIPEPRGTGRVVAGRCAAGPAARSACRPVSRTS